jgi:hypothetical protein
MARPTGGPELVAVEEPRAVADDAPAKAADAARKAAEDQRRAAEERAAKEAVVARVELDRLDAELEKVDERQMRKLIEARMAFLMEEDRVQRLLTERANQRDVFMPRVQKAEQGVLDVRQKLETLQKQAKLGNDEPWVKEWQTAIQQSEQHRDAVRQQLKEFDDKWADRVLEARKRMVVAEEAYKLEERRAAAQRQRMQTRIDAVAARVAQLQGLPDRPAAAADRRIADLERKLDDLLTEVKELRRELRK